jgi:hypothetical protein
MKITLDVPSLRCARCAVEAPIRPQVLYPNAPIDPVFSEPLSEMYRVRPDAEVVALDDQAQSWRVILASRPIGWTALPTGDKGVLCGDCAAGWHNAAKAFMVPPPPPVVEEALVLATDAPPAPVAEPAFSGNKPSPFKQNQGFGAQRTPSPFQQPAGTNVSGPQNIVYGKPGSPNNISIKR